MAVGRKVQIKVNVEEAECWQAVFLYPGFSSLFISETASVNSVAVVVYWTYLESPGGFVKTQITGLQSFWLSRWKVGLETWRLTRSQVTWLLHGWWRRGGGVGGRHTLKSTVLKHFVLNFIVLYSVGNIWGENGKIYKDYPGMCFITGSRNMLE